MPASGIHSLIDILQYLTDDILFMLFDGKLRFPGYTSKTLYKNFSIKFIILAEKLINVSSSFYDVNVTEVTLLFLISCLTGCLV